MSINLVTAGLLAEWTAAQAYQMTAITYSALYTGAIASAALLWPDGSAGTLTTVLATPGRVESYTVTHTDSGLTVRQAVVTRNDDNLVVIKPVLTVEETA